MQAYLAWVWPKGQLLRSTGGRVGIAALQHDRFAGSTARMTHLRRLPRTAAALSLALALAACGQGQQASNGPPPPTVTVAKPTVRAVTDQDEYVGRFVAIDAVEIRARVSGYLDKIHFRDGQMVKQGDLLFTIDKRPFENTVAQARANLAQARANLAFAESDLDRGKQLVRERTISEQVFQQRTQAFGSAQACGRRQRGGRQAGRARSGFHRIACAGRGPHRRPPRVARQPGDRRHDRDHDHARHHRVDGSDPLRVHHG